MAVDRAEEKLAAKEPFINQLTPSLKVKNACAAGCGAFGTKKCGACQRSYYCSTNCCRAHWKAAHKAECGERLKEENIEKRLEMFKDLKAMLKWLLPEIQDSLVAGGLYHFKTVYEKIEYVKVTFDSLLMQEVAFSLTREDLFVQIDAKMRQ